MRRWISWGMVWILAIACAGSAGRTSAQTHYPRTLDLSPGVHLFSHDGKQHRPAAHYAQLCRIVHQEFGIPEDSISVILVFVDEALRESLNVNNPQRFQSALWSGAFIRPFLILMLGEEESDDTFMHEYMHGLQARGLLFSDVHPSRVHQLTDVNEGLLLGSRSYLEYLKSRR